MKPARWLPALGVFGVILAAQLAPTSVEEMDRAWVKAVLARDIPTLDLLLSDRLIYAHASGVIDSKQDYLEKIRSGRQLYKSLEQKIAKVEIHGGAALTQSWVRVTGVNPQGPFDDKVMMMHVWVREGNRWRLAGHQTARIDRLP